MSWTSLVWNQVEEFRRKYPCDELETIPIDTIHLADVELGLDLIPYDELYSKYRVEAALLADFSGIYVDAEIYDLSAKAPPWKQNRLRFSIAHEIGHLILHRERFEREGFADVETFIEWSKSLGGQKYQIEMEANEFAGRLLVPRYRLEAELKALEEVARVIYPNWRHEVQFRLTTAERIGQKFGVCQKSMLARFSREELWPDPSF